MIDAALRDREATLEKAGGPGRKTEGERAGSPSNRPVRVCFVIDWLGVGGTETQLLALIRESIGLASFPISSCCTKRRSSRGR